MLLECGFVAAILFLVALFRYYRDKPKNVAGVFEIPILGTTLSVWANLDRLYEWILENALQFPEGHSRTFTGKILGYPRFIGILDPKNVQHVLKDKFPIYEKGKQFRSNMHDLLGDGIFNSDGQQWFVQRKTTSRMFSHRAFRDHMSHVFHHHGLKVVSILEEHAKNGKPLDLQNLFFRFTLDSIGEIALGANIGSLEDPSVPFAVAFDEAQYIVDKRFFWPFWKITRFCSPRERRLKKAIKLLHRQCNDIIQEKMRGGVAHSDFDFLSLFMDNIDVEGENGEARFRYLRDVVLNFIIAGRDTTAQAMSWMIYELICNPEVADSIADEVTSVNCKDDVPSFEEASKLKYTRAAFLETLRLHPSVPKDMKCAVADDTLPDGTFIKKGTFVAYFPWIMGRLPDLWPNPLKYDPQRFVEEPNPSLYKFPAFNAGERTCLGMRMAELEGCTLIGALTKKFRFSLEKGHTVRYQESLTLPMKYGLRVNVSLR